MSERLGFNLAYIEKELDRLVSMVTADIVIYVAGGCAMTYYKLKEATKDIDVIVEDRLQLRTLQEVLKKLGYSPIHKLTPSHRKLSASFVLENADGFRWDIFERVVANKLALTEMMKKRATVSYQKDRLTVFTLSREDIFLMKSVTDRDLDLEDMYLLARSGLNYDTVLKECLLQSEITNRLWEPALYDRCVEVREKFNLVIPFENKIRKLADEKMLMKILLDKIHGGHNNMESLVKACRGTLTKRDVRYGLKILSEKGHVVIRDGRISVKNISAAV